MRKIKIFLGGYINYTNAQNLNCRSISNYLDKDRFEIYTLKSHFGDNTGYKGRSFYCFRPFGITRHLGFFWGILNCDIAYLPKHIDTPLWVLKFAKLLGRSLFSTIEGNVTDVSKSNLIELFSSEEKMKNHFSYFNAVFGISPQLINNASQVIEMRKTPLYLGVDSRNFSYSTKEKLSSIVFVGGLIKRKRVDKLIELSRRYSNIQFKIIGEGSEQQNLQNKAPDNVLFLGSLSHKEMDLIFSSSDLLFLPSKSEGFPKVILEAASAGIPSLVYDSYGASDWINHKKNGFIISNFDQVESLVDELLENPKLLHEVSNNTKELANKFDWSYIINDWEKVILDLYNGK